MVEVLIATGLLSLLGLGVVALNMGTVARIAQQQLARDGDASSLQLAATRFARDVAGSASITADHCGESLGGEALVSFVQSKSLPSAQPALNGSPAAQSGVVSYRSTLVGTTKGLVRADCTEGDARYTVLIEGLKVRPTPGCDGGPCNPAAAPTPRRVTLVITTPTNLIVTFEGVRRIHVTPTTTTTTTTSTTTTSTTSTTTSTTTTTTTLPPTTTTTPPPAVPPRLLALAGSGPVRLTGSGGIKVTGAAYFNKPSNGSVALSVEGGSNVTVSGGGPFAIQSGATCSGCDPWKVSPPPTTMAQARPDPFASLPVPSRTGLSNRSCNKCTTMQPGVYTAAVKLTGGGAVTMQPGVYVFRKGFSIAGNIKVTGRGVLIYNGCEREQAASCSASGGSLSVGASGLLDVTPLEASHPLSGTYGSVVLLQAATNTSTMTVDGSGLLTSPTGSIYVPGTNSLAVGGSGKIDAGWLVAKNLTVTGNSRVELG